MDLLLELLLELLLDLLLVLLLLYILITQLWGGSNKPANPRLTRRIIKSVSPCRCPVRVEALSIPLQMPYLPLLAMLCDLFCHISINHYV